MSAVEGDEAEARIVEDAEVSETEALAEVSVASTPPSSTGHSGKKRQKKHVVVSRAEASHAARNMLVQTVRRLPFPVNETHTVRSFGQLRPSKPLFSTTNALFPAGFSCDRHEFSPAHGRMLKLRCTILDGVDVGKDGPIFRVAWGDGIDFDQDGLVDYPFDILRAKQSSIPCFAPSEGMRVRVRYDQGNFAGTIVEVDDKEIDPKTKKDLYNIRIQYDDGSEEDAQYPDPDIVLFPPGSDDASIRDGDIHLTSVSGKQVSSAVGSSPISAWGNVLSAMGLVDEITVEGALAALQVSREIGVAKAKDKMDSKNQKSPQTQKTKQMKEHEETSENEENILRKIKALQEQLETVEQQDRDVARSLGDARIGLLGNFLCNPFQKDSAQETMWLSQVVRKEKLKMGSTGPRRKVVTATDLLERNDTFYDMDVEALVEGLPGSEDCKNYIFLASRAGGASSISQQWIHEARFRQERMAERAKKAEMASKAKSQNQLEKERKRKARDDERDARKKQKQEELDDKKKARFEERMRRLREQVEERLYKEACAQREKVVLGMQKVLFKEFSRRKKAAELVASQAVFDEKLEMETSNNIMKAGHILSPLGRSYDGVVVQLWDFVSNSFGETFLQWGYLKELPTLDSLQGFINAMRTKGDQGISTRKEAANKLTELAIALCKPVAVTCTRFLFASLIALNPALQKVFGAAFFAEVRSNEEMENEAEGPSATDLLPVTPLTWMAIARLGLLSSAAVELGLSKQESAHLIRGYRSSGHPNSKEAKRLRKVEDHFTTCLRMRIAREAVVESTSVKSLDSVVRFPTPSLPSASPSDWVFYLHNIKGISASKPNLIQQNLKKAVSAIIVSESSPDGYVETLQKQLSIFEKAMKGDADLSSSRRAKTAVLKLMDEYLREPFSTDVDPTPRTLLPSKYLKKNEVVKGLYGSRNSLALVEGLQISKIEHRAASQKKQKFMDNALQLKKTMNEEDEEDEDEEESSKPKPSSSHAKALADDSTLASVVENEVESTSELQEVAKLGKPTPYDDFAGDLPSAPDLIRRCLAVLRTLCGTNAAEPFIYPVDPQTNPGYYESILRPMCLREIGKQLQGSADSDGDELDLVVAEFARSVRLIARNCSCYGNAGPMIIAGGDEMLRIFERLFLHWVLFPEEILPDLSILDDDKCVDIHESDDDSMVLLCDSCEGKYNMGLLDPPMKDVPKGDWFCPRCVNCLTWGDVDPRIGKKLPNVHGGLGGVVHSHQFVFPEGTSRSGARIDYLVDVSGKKITLSLSEVDKCLFEAGTPVKPISCIQAIAESPGYGNGIDRLLYPNLVPVPLNPNISEQAAQVATESSVYRDMLLSSSELLMHDPEDFIADEWLRMLGLLLNQCSASEMLLSRSGNMENESAEKMAEARNASMKIREISQILPHPFFGESTGQPNSGQDTVLIDSQAIEVVSNPKPNAGVAHEAYAVTVGNEQVDDFGMSHVQDLGKKSREAARKDIENRTTKREESLTALTVKMQCKATVASFEIDGISQVVDGFLASQEDLGVGLGSSRSIGLSCAFCGLSDVALGTPLVRVPNSLEWKEMMAHSSRMRKVFLLADMGDSASQTETKPHRLVAVKLRIEGALFSVPAENQMSDSVDGGMVEFLPRNAVGFQDDIGFRYNHSLPFVTGSASAHECCAIAAHDARKEKVQVAFRETSAEIADKSTGGLCGRTLSLGKDGSGRSYWKFNKDHESLFVEEQGRWKRYQDTAVIASIIFYLGDQQVTRTLKRSFPDAVRLLNGKQWAAALQRRNLNDSRDRLREDSRVRRRSQSVVDEDEHFEAGEEILVESTKGGIPRLWDAQVVATSQNSSGEIDCYRVHYHGWSSRYDEWVEAERIVEPNENNKIIQSTMQEDSKKNIHALPHGLTTLKAVGFLRASDRVRKGGLFNIASVVSLDQKSPGDAKFAYVKASLLLIEGALPIGSIDNTPNGAWRPEFASQWRKTVADATGPATLLACGYLLEENIVEDWIDEQALHMLSCLPVKWKAVEEASVSSLALRLALLDQGLKYDEVDKTKFKARGRR